MSIEVATGLRMKIRDGFISNVLSGLAALLGWGVH
jgi:hypothetical protein